MLMVLQSLSPRPQLSPTASGVKTAPLQKLLLPNDLNPASSVQLLQQPCVLVYLSVLTLPPCSAVSNNPPPCSTAYNNLLNFWQRCAFSGRPGPPTSAFPCLAMCFFISSMPPSPPPPSGLSWNSARCSSPSCFLHCLFFFFVTEFEGFPSRSLVYPCGPGHSSQAVIFPYAVLFQINIFRIDVSFYLPMFFLCQARSLRVSLI